MAGEGKKGSWENVCDDFLVWGIFALDFEKDKKREKPKIPLHEMETW